MAIVTKKIWAWKCEIKKCGHEWQSADGKKPLRCAYCKSPYWDKSSNGKRNGK